MKLSLYDGLDKHWGKQQDPTKNVQGLCKNRKVRGRRGQLFMRRYRPYVVPCRAVIYTVTSRTSSVFITAINSPGGPKQILTKPLAKLSLFFSSALFSSFLLLKTLKYHSVDTTTSPHAISMAQRLVACYRWIKAASGGSHLYAKISNRGTPYKKLSKEPTLIKGQDVFGDNTPLLE